MQTAELTWMLAFYKGVFELAALSALLDKLEDRIYG